MNRIMNSVEPRIDCARRMVSVLALIVMLTVAGSALAQTSPPETAAPADSHPLASRLHVMNDYENYVGEAFAFGSMIHANPGNGFPDTRLYGWDCQATQWEQPWIGMTVEASGYYGKIHYPFGAGGPSKVGTDQISTMAGPNFRPIRRKLVSASFFGLIGTVRAHIDQRELGVTLQYDDDMKLGFAFGSSVDFRIRRWVGWGVQPAVYTTRFAGQTQKDFRLSTGPVFRFNRREN